MKKLLTCLALVFAVVAAPAAAEPLKVVASFSILGDMVTRIADGRVELTVLVGSEGDAHTFEPGPAHAAALADANLLVVNGLGFEPWMVRLAAAAKSKAAYAVASFGINPRDLEEDHVDDHGQGHDEKGYPSVPHDFDPHGWQNAANGAIYARNIAEALAKADPANAGAYEANAAAYIAELKELDAWVRAEIGKVPAEKRKVITTHDAFGYFGDAYGVEFHAPLGFAGGAQPSAQALARLIDQIRAENIKALFIETMSDPRMMETIARETGAEMGGALYSDALSGADGAAPTYIDMFRHNVPLLVAAMLKN
ncbi:MAG: zinc ABC transporter substrate-binding protein [Parvibaculum sp.]|uniref:metal ABC transporter solute-binding protein, Zn/Mn family n=1 Tax=Parvibaculum sp. TaxID=2024848 RepID=UPI00271D560E|nr:zinc ABC transporter substrate-binding protein [Parvibaculum sp.]MDO8839989.1 zinc ABC transporter substrate-binding protein [Parvibaculum sp.]